MELDSKLLPELDLQTETMLPIHTDAVCHPLENIKVKQEPEFHTGGDSSKLIETMKPVDDIAHTFDIKTEAIDNDHYQHMAIHYDHDSYSNINCTEATDTGMIRDIHMDPVKSEPHDEALETNDRNGFMIEIDTCKYEYYETHQGSGGDCVTKEDLYLEHTSVDTPPCTVVLHDIQYIYPDILTHGYVPVYDKEPTIQIRVQPTTYVHALQEQKHKPYICYVCGVGFTLKGNMDKHTRIHTGEKPHKCSVCEVSFTQKGTLAVHMRTHTREKPYTCPVCGVRFAQANTLKYHITIHTGDKPYACSLCGVRFSKKCDLKTHTRIHTGEKPHKCTVCEVSFSQKGNLAYHMRTHTGEKPHTCVVCGDEFTRKHGLQLHTRIHTGEKPYKCSVCEVSFAERGSLTRHMRTHTGEKPYKCSVCGVGFTNSHHLKKHKIIHTGEKPHTVLYVGLAS